MKRLRFWSVTMVVWLVAFNNVERLHAPINIASFVYVFSAAAGAAVLLVPWLARLPLYTLLALCAPSLLAAKWWLGYPILAAGLPFTVTEFCSIGVTVFLARQLVFCLLDFEEAVHASLLGPLQLPEPFATGQVAMYWEVHRARVHERPLALLALSVPKVSAEAALGRMMREVQQAAAGKYLAGRVVDLLRRATHNCGIIAYRDDHFVLALPEAGAEQASALSAKLKGLAREELKLDLHVGWSTFPDEEVTLDQLLERAAAAMHWDVGSNGSAGDELAQDADGVRLPTTTTAPVS